MYEEHFGSSSAEVATFQHKCSTPSVFFGSSREGGKLVGFGMAANELGIGWASVWALQIDVSAILVCDNHLDLMCVIMASGGIVFSFSTVSVYNGFGLQKKLRDGPLHSEKARGCAGGI